MPQTLDTLGIAQLLGLSRDYTTDHVTKQPTFPKPVINISNKCRRWSLEEVLKWARGPR